MRRLVVGPGGDHLEGGSVSRVEHLRFRDSLLHHFEGGMLGGVDHLVVQAEGVVHDVLVLGHDHALEGRKGLVLSEAESGG